MGKNLKLGLIKILIAQIQIVYIFATFPRPIFNVTYMTRLFFGFLFFLHLAGFSQDQDNAKSFDSLFYEIAVNISSSDPSKAMHLSDSLYNYSVNARQKVRALMLSADIFSKQERRQESIEYALKALKIAESSKDYSFQARIYGFMSTEYRLLGFLDKGKEYLLKGMEVSNKIEDKNQVTKFQAMANHELADFAMEAGEYEEAIQYLNLALLGYQKEENEQMRYFVMGNAEELLGRSNMALGNDEEALEHFSKANVLVNKSGSGNTIWAAMIYQGIGAMYLKGKQLDSAEVYLKKSLLISDPSSHGSLKELVFESMTSYYKHRGHLDSSAIFASKYRDISRTNTSKKRQMVNREFNRALSASGNDSQQSSSFPYIVGIIGLLLLLAVFYFWKKRPSSKINRSEAEKSPDGNGITISDSTLKELMQKLQNFEDSENYLDKNMSFSLLVGYLNTNAKYLNYILKNIKEKDFNSYINDLRVEYIISKLKSDPQYLNYKISHLADISGFSSHSNFSANFKRSTDLSPSDFIDDVRKTG